MQKRADELAMPQRQLRLERFKLDGMIALAQAAILLISCKEGGEKMKKISKLLVVMISLLFAFTMATASLAAEKGKMCPKCGKEIQTKNAMFYVVYKSGKKESFGCPHCGLSEINKGNVKSAMATDFLRGKKIDADKAFYLKGSEFGTCCSPYWLTFSSKDEAEKFSKGFGGMVMTYEEALKDKDVQP